MFAVPAFLTDPYMHEAGRIHGFAGPHKMGRRAGNLFDAISSEVKLGNPGVATILCPFRFSNDVECVTYILEAHTGYLP